MWSVPSLAQQQNPNIFEIVDQFMISNAAATKCTKPDQDKLARFLLNFQIVTTHALQQAKKQSPELTPEHFDKLLKEQYAAFDKMVIKIIGQETCKGATIKEVLRRFDAQATMDLTGAFLGK